MDHVVHINNGGKDNRPIVIHLLPGEEIIFNLKVINHGDPANISMQASNPVFKAVRLKKPDHYVISEEVIPILARMPADRKRLDGEIILSAGGSESRVPIILLRDSEDTGADLEDPGLRGDEDLKDDAAGEERNGEDAGEHEDDDEEYEDESWRRGRRFGDEEDGESERADGNGKEPRRISFSRDADLQRYRSARRQGRLSGAASSLGDGVGKGDGEEESGFIPRYRTRVDRSFVDKSNLEDDPQSERRTLGRIPGAEEEEKEARGIGDGTEEGTAGRIEDGGEKGIEQSGEEEPGSLGEEEAWQGYRQEADSESRELIHQAEREEIVALDGEKYERREEYNEEEDRQEDLGERRSSRYALLGRMGGFSFTGSIQAVPSFIFLALIVVLVLTFITGIIPEFPGALGSSILIVTLIIYGAAKLLKA